MDYGLDEYDLLDDQPTPFTRWVVPALIISLLLHALFLVWLWHQNFALFTEAPAKPIPPPTFKLVRLPPMDPQVLEPRVAEIKHAAAMPQAVNLPRDKPSLGAMMDPNHGLPAAPKIDQPLLAEKPKVEATSYTKTVQDAENGGVKSVASDRDQIRSELLAEKPGIDGKPVLDLARPDLDSGGSPSTTGAAAGSDKPGFSNLDDLLAQTGPLSSETAPIRMDSDVLYEYDSFQLQPQAVASLQKLGEIIQRNPQLDFSIEGHSDSFGPDDYNLQLSLNRAESVKAWLVQNMGIDPARITTKGFGKTRLIVPAANPDGTATTIEQQEINRRVEIVLHDRNQTH